MDVIDTDNGSEYIYMTIPVEYKDLYNKLLICLSEYGIELILDCQASCASKNKNIIDCWNMFQSMIACYNLGETNKARVFKEYIESQLEIYYKCNEESEEIKNILNVNPTILNFENEFIKKINIESNTNWNIKTMAEWINIEPKSGDGNGYSNISVENYTGRTNRSSNVIIATSNDKKQVQIKINQSGKHEFITINNTNYNIDANGGTVVISGISNSSNLKIVPSTFISNVTQTLKINNNDESSWDGINNISINGDPGSDQEFNFEITFTIQANQSQEERNHVFKITNGDSIESSYITITQTSGTITYGKPVITSFTYNVISANGGSVLPNITYSQTWGWNGSPTGGGTITSGATLSYAGSVVDSETGEVSAESKEQNVSAETTVDNVTVTVNLNGKTETAQTEVKQEANSITYGNVSLDLTTPVSLQAQGQTYDLGAQVDAKFAQTLTFTSGATRDGEITLEDYSVVTAKEGFSLNDSTGEVTVTQNPGTSARNGFVVKVTVTGEGSKSAIVNVTFNQQGSSSYIIVTPESLEFESAGGTKTINIESNDSWTIS